MRMLVLGAGQQGSACAYDVLTHTDHEVVIGDLNVQQLPDFLLPFLGSRLTARELDAEARDSVRDAMTGVTVTMNALPYRFNLSMASAAIEAGSHYCDLGGNTGIVLEQLELNDRAVEAGVSVVPDCGLAPGLVNVLAESGIERLDRPTSVRMLVGGLPQDPEPPLNYQVVYSLAGVLDYYTTPSWILRNGRLERVEALSGLERIEFPGIGDLEAFHTAGGLSTMAQRYEGRLESMEYKTLRYPGHAAAMQMMRDLGLFDLDPVEVGGKKIVPRDAFMAIVGPRLRKDPRESPDVVALRVEVTGERQGRQTTLTWELVDRYEAATGVTAMMRTTGYSLAIIGALQAEGAVSPGVHTPDLAVPSDRYVAELQARGIAMRYSES